MNTEIKSTASTRGKLVMARCLLALMFVQVFEPAALAYRYSDYSVALLPKSENLDSKSSAVLGSKNRANAHVAVSNAVLSAASASNGGPGGQTEASGFSLNTNSELVDPFTGDFSYNIPLISVEGYPITLSYNSNIGMMDEASWVGLGWNLNVGSISREKRGIPDEFDGTQTISSIHNQKQDENTDGKKNGFVGGVMYKGLPGSRISKFGLDLSILGGSYRNSYIGQSRTFDLNIGTSLEMPFGSNDDGTQMLLPFNLGFGYSRDDKNGIGRSTTMGFSDRYVPGGEDSPTFSLGASSNYSTRAGITSRGISVGISSMPLISSLGGFSPTFTCGTATYVPRINYSTKTNHFNTTTDLTAGFMMSPASQWGFSAGYEHQDYYSTQETEYSNNTTQAISSPAFGYFYSQKSENYTGSAPVTMDFNRERDVQFSEEMENLPYAFPTYDIFYVNGAGLSGTFRGQRNDIGVYKDADVNSTTKSVTKNPSLGIQIYATQLPSLTVGYVHTEGNGDNESGEWVEGSDFFSFGSDSKVTFKGVGEQTPKTSNLFGVMGGANPSALVLQKSETPPSISKTNQLMTLNTDGSTPTATLSATTINAENVADTRATIYRPLTPAQVTYPAIGIYNPNTFYGGSMISGSFNRTDANHLANHISGIEVINTSGQKYFYGLPIYSKNESEVGFATNATSGDSQGLVGYTAGTENTITNTNGSSNYYDKTTTPAYASSFLLTHILSDDYYDISSNGPSLDDPGNYYKFNYTRLYSTDAPYKWRMPYNTNKAFFNENLLSIETDNMAMYTYGEKEIWYTHSVESKNMIAEFTISNRDDAYGVNGENGGMNTGMPLKKLDKITVYNRSERLADGATAKPMMTVEFKYDYSLCPQNPSNINASGPNTGKLTLLEIRVYSGPVSEETALAPIKFTYGSGTSNPAFSNNATDRWGAYKPYNSSRPSEIYPNAEQNENTANTNCKAWKLIKIESPGGSSMEIDYAADHYAFVQSTRATKHMDLKGFMTQFELNYLLDQSTWDASTYLTNNFHKSLSDSQIETFMGLTSFQLFNTKLAANQVYNMTNTLTDLSYYAQLDNIPADVVIFELDSPMDGPVKADVEKEFRDKYLKRTDYSPDGQGYMDEVYFRSMVNVKSGYTAEMIATFSDIKKMTPGNLGDYAVTGLLPKVGGSYRYGYIVLESVQSTEDKKMSFPWSKDPILMHPLEKSAMEFARLNLSEIVYLAAPSQTNVNPTVDHGTFWTGDVNQVMQKNNFCTGIVSTLPSQLRLCDADNMKFGGGAYVKSITTSDNWDIISGEYKSNYRTIWERTKTDGERPGSYGVASWEPSIGGDENALYSWDRYTDRAVAFPDQSQHSVMPIGEALFPSPVVGYSQVKTTINGSQYNVAGTSIYETAPLRDGYSIFHFYTAYDKPTSSRSTEIQSEKADNIAVFKNEIDLYGFSQGHVIVTNDFHGKPKFMETFDQFGVSLASTTYNYRTPGATVKMIDKIGNVSEERVAMEYDIMVDSRFVSSIFSSWTLGASVPFKLPFFIPGIPTPIINFSRREVGFYSHVINKHVNYSAVLESVVTNTMGSVVSAEEIIYDKESGNVLLTALNDEYNDKIYSFSYPAHWYYTLFRNPLEKLTPATGTMAGGQLTSTTHLVDKLTVGDLVSITNGSSTVSAYVLTVDGLTARFINSNGTTFGAITGSVTVSVTESGRKNILMNSMQSVVTKRNPLSGLVFTFPSADIINSNALTFRPRLNMLCDDFSGEKNVVKVGTKINPFKYGLLNNLMEEYEYNPQLQLSTTAIQGLRFNSVYDQYYSFYKKNSLGYWVQIDEPTHPDSDPLDLKNWRPSGGVTVTDELGRNLELKNEINIPSAILYGYNKYNKLVPIAKAVNAQLNEIAFESFDDHSYMSGSNASSIAGHFNFVSAIAANPSVLSLSSVYRHSGINSLKINGVGTASVTRDAILSTECTPVTSFTGSEYLVTDCACVKPFEPIREKEYVVSFWVKGTTTAANGNYNTAYGEISFVGSGITVLCNPTGQVIDGWQRVEQAFTIPAGATKIIVSLKNSNTGAVYFDDIRIHPFQAGMATTVYDPETMLPMASHDGNNYTTFYGYDENLSPVRVRVETMNGIQTVTETEGSTVMKFKQ